MDYRVFAHKITGRTAIVDISVSAVAAGEAVQPLLAQAATYLAFQRLLGNPADLGGYLPGRLALLLAEQPAVTTLASLHLILGGDGAWKLDLSDKRNLPFLDALLGGGAAADGLRLLADSYGFFESQQGNPDPL
jgi:hypothetical protein